MRILIDVIGWLGMIAILAAYALISQRRVDARSYAYQLPNICGAIGLVINCFWSGAMPAAALNVVWFAIGIKALTARSIAFQQYAKVRGSRADTAENSNQCIAIFDRVCSSRKAIIVRRRGVPIVEIRPYLTYEGELAKVWRDIHRASVDARAAKLASWELCTPEGK